MAGRPKRKAMVAELERLTRAEFGEEPATHLDFVVEWTESGRMINELLDLLSVAAGDEVKRSMLMRYLNDTFDGAERRVADARVEGAHALVEDAFEVLEDVGADKDQVARAKAQAEMRQWLAGKWNRGAYGEPKAGVNVQLNLGSAFLDSLRRQAQSSRLSATPARAFSSVGAEGSALPAGSSAIVPAIADEAQDVTFEVLSG